MTDLNWKSDELEIDLVNEDDLAGMELEVVEGSLELPPDLADESLDVDQSEHLENASTAQAAADNAIEVGDYQSAAELREVAENESAAAGSDAILEGANSVELENAAEHQDNAETLEAEQTELAQDGDYGAALETSREAAIETQSADELAGGSDHSGQAQLEIDNLEWAEFHQEIADQSLNSASEYAESGNLDAAENSLGVAADEQVVADHYGDLGEHDGAIADFDPTSYVESNPVDSYSPTDIDVTDTSSTSSTIDTSTTDSTTDSSSVDDFST